MKRVFLLLSLLMMSIGVSWAQYTWTNSSTAITTEAWASADNWTCADGTTFPTGGAGPMTSNSDAWKMVYITGASGTVADLEGWNPKMTLDATTLTVENMRKMQGGDKNFTLKNGSTLSITLHKSNSGNDGATVPITFTGNGNTFNLYLAGNMGGDGTIVNYGAVTDGSTNKYNVSSSATGTARTFNALTLKATIEGENTSETNILHSVVLGNISSDITVTTLTYDITAENYTQTEGVLNAETGRPGTYSVVKGADGNVTLYWVTGPSTAQTVDATGLFTTWAYHTATSGSWYGKCTSNTTPAIAIEQRGTEDVIGWSTSNSVKRPWLKAGYTYNITPALEEGKVITGYTLTTQSTSSGYTSTYTYTTKDGTATSEAQAVNTNKTVTVKGLNAKKITITLGGEAGSSNYGVLVTGLTVTYDEAPPKQTRSRAVIAFGSTAGKAGSTTDNYNVTGVGEQTWTLSNGNTAKITPTSGNLWSGATDGGIVGTWSNAAVIEEINTELATAFTADDFGSASTLYYTASGNSGSTSSVTLGFAGSEAAGDNVTIYASVARRGGKMDNISVTGLKDAAISYATNSGTGFSTTASYSEGTDGNKSVVTIVKITGTLTGEKSVVLSSTSAKNGWQIVACKVVEGDVQMADVTLKYKWNGTTVKTIQKDLEEGETVVADEIRGYTVTQPTATATAGLSVDVECTPYVPYSTVYIANDNDTKLQASDENGTLTFSEVADRCSEKYIWRVNITSDGYYTFQNLATGKYMKHKGIQDAAYNFDLETGIVSGNYALKSVAANTHLCIKNDGSLDQASGTFNKTSTDYSTDFIFEEAAIYTLTINTEPTVSGVFTWNGETKRGTSVTFSHISGTPVDNSAISFIENGYTAALDEDTWNGESNLTVTATMSESFFSSLYGDKWVRITSAINANAAMYATEHMGTENIDVTNDAELFCFVGNADGFQIFNKAKGEDYALYVENGEESITNGTAPSWVDAAEGSTWYLDVTYLDAASQPGYGLTTEQEPAHSLNLWGGGIGEAKFWDNGASNGGSRWFIQQVDENLINIDLAEDNPYTNNYMLGKVNIAYGGTSTTSYITRDNVGTQTLYLPVGLTPTVSVAYQYRGYTHSQEGNDITFTNDGTKYQYLWYEDPDYQFYRIPAIITKPNGQLIAFSDYRYCHNDIGYGRVDQYMRMSSDNGENWTEPTLVLEGKNEIAEGEDVFYKGFGDPALVADRESDRILLLTVAGNNFYGNGNTNYWNDKPNYFARTYSENGGASWGDPENITEQIYTLFSETADGENHVDAAFVGSGKIFQSRVTKVGEYYRLYAALCARPNGNRVIYSDDFGMTWKVLGGASARPAPYGDEPKCEELPDGSVILSSRKSYGRYFNIYTYTDTKTGAGAWGDCVDSSNSNTTGGIAVGNNSTNGEIMIVNAKKKNDDKIYTVALQSLPFGNGRNGVGLYWKDITDKSTYQVDGANSSLQFAKNWTRGLKVETLCDTYGTSVGYSAYSTFTLQDDKKIGFFYEESPGTYAMVYVPLGIDEITDNAYSEIVDYEIHTMKIGEAGYSTLCLPFNAIKPNGVELYTGTYNSELKTLTLAEAGDVKANEGYIVKASEGYHSFVSTSSSVDAPASNSLVGVTTPIEISSLTGGTPYILNYDAERNPQVQFNKIKETTGTIPAFKAYLWIPTSSNPIKESIPLSWGDDETAISVLTPSTGMKDGKFLENNKIVILKNGMKYNVSGQRMK